jgi:hypothetical protein
MRHVLLLLALAACDSAASRPPKPGGCPRECRADESDCSSFPYESLPARCQDICYLGECCDLVNGAWAVMTVDCARPRMDAGVDALPIGAPGG